MINGEFINEIIDEVGSGATEPLNGKIQDKYVIVKTNNNVESNRVLANELVGYKIAKKLGLPIPNGGICNISRDTIISSDICFDEEKYGLGFYSERLNKVTNIVSSPKIIQKHISNKGDLPKIILYDHLIYNKDRHKGNILIDIAGKTDKKLHIIDHSHIFNIGPLWDEYQLRRFINEKDYMSTEILEYNKGLYDIFFQSINIDLNLLIEISKQFQDCLTEEFISDIIINLPEQWQVTDNQKRMLIDYILYRLKNLDTICSVIDTYVHLRR